MIEWIVYLVQTWPQNQVNKTHFEALIISVNVVLFKQIREVKKSWDTVSLEKSTTLTEPEGQRFTKCSLNL